MSSARPSISATRTTRVSSSPIGPRRHTPPLRSTNKATASGARWKTRSRSTSSTCLANASPATASPPTRCGFCWPVSPSCYSRTAGKIGLAGSTLARATVGTIRLQLLKLAAQVTVSSAPRAPPFRQRLRPPSRVRASPRPARRVGRCRLGDRKNPPWNGSFPPRPKRVFAKTTETFRPAKKPVMDPGYYIS